MIPTRLFGVSDTRVLLNRKTIGAVVVFCSLLTGAYFLGQVNSSYIPPMPPKNIQRIDSQTLWTIITMREYSTDLYQHFRSDSYKTGENVLNRIAGIQTNSLDSWGMKFKIEYKEGEDLDVSIRSAGADGCWNTADDLLLESKYAPHYTHYVIRQYNEQLLSQDTFIGD